MFPFNKKQDGQILIESIISISIAVVGLLGILTLLSRSISLNRNVTGKFVATYLAAEGIEVVKNIIDANYTKDNPWSPLGSPLIADGSYEVAYDTTTNNLLPLSSNPLLFDDTKGIYSYDSGDATGFRRTIRIENLACDASDCNEIKVNAVVDWTDKGEAKKVILEDHFFNWRTPQP